MTKPELIQYLRMYRKYEICESDIVDKVEVYSSANNYGKQPVSGSLPPLPDWNEVIKGIDDSRFTDMPNCYTVREGARIMYDRLYSMLSRRQ